MTDTEVDPFAEFAPPEPEHRQPKFNRWGWYEDLPAIPGHGTGPWPRVTTIKETLTDQYGLTQWKQRQVLLGAAQQPELLKAVSGARFNPTSDHGKRTLNALVDTMHDVAGSFSGADKGTVFHKHSEALDAGADPKELGLTREQYDMLRAYWNLRKNAGIKPSEYSERIVFIPALGAAGTLDRLDWDSDVLKVGDVKTQKSLDFDGMSIPIQLAMYAHAEFILDHDTWTWLPMPKVDLRTAMVYWVPASEPGRAELHDIDLVKGWKYAQASVRVREWRKDKSTITRRVI